MALDSLAAHRPHLDMVHQGDMERPAVLHRLVVVDISLQEPLLCRDMHPVHPDIQVAHRLLDMGLREAAILLQEVLLVEAPPLIRGTHGMGLRQDISRLRLDT